MEMLRRFWNDFKLQPETWFFYAFFVTATLSIRKIFYVMPVQGNFNEYTSAYFYFSDIFFFLLIFTWSIKLLNNKKSLLSRLKTSVASRETLIKNCFLFLPLLLVIWSFISVFWADDKIIAIFRSAKLAEFFLIYLFVIWKIGSLGRMEKNVPTDTECSTRNFSRDERENEIEPVDDAQFKAKNSERDFLGNLVWLALGIGVMNSLIAIGQFILQHSLGLVFLRESIISPNIVGVAKIVVHGQKFIRSYGLFPHPNILGGFLLFSVLLNFALMKGKFYLVNVSREANILTAVGKVPRGTYLYFILTIQLIALAFTFSKSAVLGLFLALFYLLAKNYENLKSILNKVKTPLLIAGIILISLFFLFRVDLNSFILRSVNDRIDQLQIYESVLSFRDIPFHPVNYNIVPHGTKLENGTSVEQFRQLFCGSGMGQYMLEIYRKFGYQLEWWQFQPIHNVFLLVFAELGLIGFLIFTAFILRLILGKNVQMSHPEKYSNVPRGTFEYHGASVEHSIFLRDGISMILLIKATLLGFVFIMLFDHYLWDIQQGQLILWLISGILLGVIIRIKKSRNS